MSERPNGFPGLSGRTILALSRSLYNKYFKSTKVFFRPYEQPRNALPSFQHFPAHRGVFRAVGHHFIRVHEDRLPPLGIQDSGRGPGSEGSQHFGQQEKGNLITIINNSVSSCSDTFWEGNVPPYVTTRLFVER